MLVFFKKFGQILCESKNVLLELPERFIYLRSRVHTRIPLFSQYWESIFIGILTFMLFTVLLHIAIFAHGFLLSDSAFNRVVTQEILAHQSFDYQDSIFGDNKLYLFYPKLFFIATTLFDLLFHPYGVVMFLAFAYCLFTLALLLLAKKIIGSSWYLLTIPLLLSQYMYWARFGYYKAEALLFAFELLFFVALFVYLKNQRWQWIVLSAVFFSASIGIKQFGIILVPTTVIFLAYLIWRLRSHLGHVMIFITVCFVLLIPVLGYQFTTTGTFFYPHIKPTFVGYIEKILHPVFSPPTYPVSSVYLDTFKYNQYYFFLHAESVIVFFKSISLVATSGTISLLSIPTLLAVLLFMLYKKGIFNVFFIIFLATLITVFFFQITSLYYFSIIGFLTSILYIYPLKYFPRAITILLTCCISFLVLLNFYTSIPTYRNLVHLYRDLITQYTRLGEWATAYIPRRDTLLALNNCYDMLYYTKHPCYEQHLFMNQDDERLLDIRSAYDLKKFLATHSISYLVIKNTPMKRPSLEIPHGVSKSYDTVTLSKNFYNKIYATSDFAIFSLINP